MVQFQVRLAYVIIYTEYGLESCNNVSAGDPAEGSLPYHFFPPVDPLNQSKLVPVAIDLFRSLNHTCMHCWVNANQTQSSGWRHSIVHSKLFLE